MPETTPKTFDFDTAMLDVFTGAVGQLLDAYEEGRITAENFLGGIRDLLTLSRNVPRSFTVDMEAE